MLFKPGEFIFQGMKVLSLSSPRRRKMRFGSLNPHVHLSLID